MNTSRKWYGAGTLTCLMAIVLTNNGPGAHAQIDYLIDANTGQVAKNHLIEFEETASEHVTLLSIQSPRGRVANVTVEADIYRNPDREPLAYSQFLNLNSSTGVDFPGVMMADNMGLGNGYTPGVDDISSYDALFFRSSSDPQPGPADFHMALWDGDPFCAYDTPGGGFSCMPIAGTEADFIDIPADTIFTATHLLPKGVTAPNQRVWMVVSGSETGVNPSPCRLGWDIAYGRAIVGDNLITGNESDDDFYLTNEDSNNGADGPGAQGICCDTTGGGVGAACSAAILCDTDTGGTRGACWDNVAETPHVYTIPNGTGTRCASHSGTNVPCSNLTAGIRAPATVTISLIPVSSDTGTIVGNELTLPGGPADFELEIRMGNWDPNNEGTLLKAWEVDIEGDGYSSGFQGYLSPTVVPCASDSECRAAFGGVCSMSGGDCVADADCPLNPTETCEGPLCAFPNQGPNAGTQCQPGFIFKRRSDYVYADAGGDLANVDLSVSYYRYSSAVQNGNGAPPLDPFPAGDAYAGTLRLYASADCKGTFTLGFKPTPQSVLVNQDNEFIPLIGFAPAKVTCEIGRCCVDATGAGGCWENVTDAQCNGAPGVSLWCPGLTCADDCIECLDDNACQDGLACNGQEVCSIDCPPGCFPGTPVDCDDGIACTGDSCIEDGGDTAHCENIPDDSNCDDGLWCNGIETCDAINGCLPGTDACPLGSCDEVNDVCIECIAPNAPQPEPALVTKNRYISVVPDNVGSLTALRVTFEDLPNDYAIWNGKTMWVTDPRLASEFSGSSEPDPLPTFMTASLSCQQDCRNWGALGLIDVFGEGIVPSGQYRVQAIDCGCDSANEGLYSTPLSVSTSKFGDLVGQFDGGSCIWTPPNSIVSIPFDTVADIEKFTNQPCAARKARTDLVGIPPNRACVDQFISVTDYVETIGAFQGAPYSFSPSDPDPCNALPCPNP